jgi:hypothetical protein
LCSRGLLPAKCAGLDGDHYYAFKTAQANQIAIRQSIGEPGARNSKAAPFIDQGENYGKLAG